MGGTPVIASGPGGPELGFIAAGLACREGGRRVLQARYPGEPEWVSRLRHQVTEALAGIPCAQDAVYALNEVASNAVVHSRPARMTACSPLPLMSSPARRSSSR
jgi:hypothetical protein